MLPDRVTEPTRDSLNNSDVITITNSYVGLINAEVFW